MAKEQDDFDQLAESLRAVADDLELLVAKVRAPAGARKAPRRRSATSKLP